VADGRWRISVTAPDWGQDHLSSEAIVAFVDGELASGPQARATQHLEECADCATQVTAQRQARAELRTAGCPLLSSALLSSLRSIPQDTDLPPAPPGLAMTADGQLVAMVRQLPTQAGGPAPASGFPLSTTTPAHHDRRPGSRATPRQRLLRVGTGVAVSGLALGAIAFAMPAAVPGPAVPASAPAADRDVGSGPVFGGSPRVLDAQLRLSPPTTPITERRNPAGFDR
jgi:anti-sigma factor RsiW